MLPPYDELAARLRDREAELAAAKAENVWLRQQLFGPGKSEKQDRLQVNLPLGEVAERPVADVAPADEQELPLGARPALRRMGHVAPEMRLLDPALDPEQRVGHLHEDHASGAPS